MTARFCFWAASAYRAASPPPARSAENRRTSQTVHAQRAARHIAPKRKRTAENPLPFVTNLGSVVLGARATAASRKTGPSHQSSTKQKQRAGFRDRSREEVRIAAAVGDQDVAATRISRRTGNR